MSYMVRFILIISLLWSHAGMAGWIVGNGGDGIRLQFLKAKEHAAHLTVRVSKKALLSVTTPEVATWIITHQDELASDILVSAHKWTQDEKPTCAWTTPVKGADVEFSFPTCLKSTASFNAAGALLVHESVHHLGVEEEAFADAVSMAVYDAHKAGKIDWLETTQRNAPTARGSHIMVWTGEEAIIQGGLLDVVGREETATGAAYNPDTDSWRSINTTGAPARYDHYGFLHDKKVIVWGGLTATTNGNSSEVWHNSGAVYDIENDSWSSLTNPYGPSTMNVRIAGKAQSAVIVGDHLVVWGGVTASRDPIPGGIFNLETGEWKEMDGSGPVRKQDHVAVAIDGKVLVWGGLDKNNRATASGAIYDLATDSWTQMSTTGAPKGLDAPRGVWTGSTFAVFGGYYSAREIRGLGGQYNPATNQWSSFVSEIAVGRKNHSALWTGQEMVVYGGWNSRLRAEFGIPLAYAPETGTWRAMSAVSSPRERSRHAAVWTGSKMLIWGGVANGSRPLASGGLFYP